MQTKLPYRRLPLQGACNVRDLGGHPCKAGMTKWGAFLRADSPYGFTPSDVQYLLDFGLTDVVDLRRENECGDYPSKLLDVESVTTVNVPMGDRMHEVNFEGELPGSMAGLYISMLDTGKPAFREAFKTYASAKGTVLFHCAVGKDRTGITSMLLLGLCGVKDEDIIADYVLSEIYLKKTVAKKIAAISEEMPDFVFRSLPESMEAALEHLYRNYGTQEEYLLKIGVSQQEIALVKAKLIGKN